MEMQAEDGRKSERRPAIGRTGIEPRGDIIPRESGRTSTRLRTGSHPWSARANTNGVYSAMQHATPRALENIRFREREYCEAGTRGGAIPLTAFRRDRRDQVTGDEPVRALARSDQPVCDDASQLLVVRPRYFFENRVVGN